MNLIKLFETQSKLDARIVEEKGLHGRDLLPEKMLALLTELGELSNEWQGFKFWKEDREPRNEIHESCKTCFGAGFDKYVNGMFDYDTPCPTCNGNQVIVKNPLLEEYVDNLHFILSIGLELHPKVAHMEWAKHLNINVEDLATHNVDVNITDMFNGIFKRVLTFHETQSLRDYANLFYLFLTLGRKLDFTLSDIETAYYSKNEINHSRQNNGY